MNQDTMNEQVRHCADNQHTVFTITRSLETLKLHGWCQVLMPWLGQYDGLEQFLPAQESPPIAVHDLLSGYLNQGSRVATQTLIDDLSGLPFLSYRAKPMQGDVECWHPLQTSFIDFAQRHNRNILVWFSDNPIPGRDATAAYLLSEHMRLKMTDRTVDPS